MEVWVSRRDADRRRDDLAGAQRRAVMDGDDADHVELRIDDDRLERVAFVEQLGHAADDVGIGIDAIDRIGAVGGEHDELREIDRVSALAQDLALRTLLAARGQEGAHVLEVVCHRVGGKRLGRRQRLAVAGEEIADLALRDRDQRDLVDAVLERHEEMVAAAQHVGLETGLAAEGDEALADRAAHRPTSSRGCRSGRSGCSGSARRKSGRREAPKQKGPPRSRQAP